MRLKVVLAFGLLALAAGGAFALAALTQPHAGAAGAHHVTIAGAGRPIFNGPVEVQNATALSVLLAAAANGGFAVEIVNYPGMGEYVRAIDGEAAQGASGWVYEVFEDGAWSLGTRGAASMPLDDGQAVRWRWSDSP